MKEQNDTKRGINRREFLGSAAAATAISLSPFYIRCASPNRSRFGGVQIGAITYSFRGLSTLEETLQACIDAGLGSIELMGSGVETYLGAPENPIQRGFGGPPPGGTPPSGRQAPTDGPGGEQAPGAGGPPAGAMPRFTRRELTPEEQAAQDQYNEELSAWRAAEGNPERYTEIRHLFNDAGIDIHIYKWTAGNSEEELDYSFKVAKALGAMGITIEGPRQPNDETAYSQVQAMGVAAENNGMYAILHQHAQYHDMTIDDIEGILDLSPAVRLNFDCGHYFGAGYDSTGEVDVIQFIEHFAGMDRIASIHLKDKTGPNTDPPNQNQVWGQGETPLADVLLLVKNKYPQIHCDIELEYPVPEGSDSVKEVKICVDYAKQILM